MDFLSRLRRSPSSNSPSGQTSVPSTSTTLQALAAMNQASRKPEFTQNFTSASNRHSGSSTGSAAGQPQAAINTTANQQQSAAAARRRSGLFTPMAVVGPQQQTASTEGSKNNNIRMGLGSRPTSVHCTTSSGQMMFHSNTTGRQQQQQQQHPQQQQQHQYRQTPYRRNMGGMATTGHAQNIDNDTCDDFPVHSTFHKTGSTSSSNMAPGESAGGYHFRSTSPSEPSSPNGRYSHGQVSAGVNAQLPRSKSDDSWLAMPPPADDEDDGLSQRGTIDEQSLFHDDSSPALCRRAHVVKVSPINANRAYQRSHTNVHQPNIDISYHRPQPYQHSNSSVGVNQPLTHSASTYAANPLLSSGDQMRQPSHNIDRLYQRYVDQILALKDQLIDKQGALDKKNAEYDELKQRYRHLRRELRSAIQVQEDTRKASERLRHTEQMLQRTCLELKQLQQMQLTADELHEINSQFDWLSLRNEELMEQLSLVEQERDELKAGTSTAGTTQTGTTTTSAQKTPQRMRGRQGTPHSTPMRARLPRSKSSMVMHKGKLLASDDSDNSDHENSEHPEFDAECQAELRQCQFVAKCLVATLQSIKSGQPPSVDLLLACKNPDLGDSDLDAMGIRSGADAQQPFNRLVQMYEDLKDAHCIVADMYKEKVADQLNDSHYKNRAYKRGNSNLFR